VNTNSLLIYSILVRQRGHIVKIRFPHSVAAVLVGVIVGAILGYLIRSMAIGLAVGVVLGVRTGRITYWRKGAGYGALIGLIVGASVDPLFIQGSSSSVSAFFTMGLFGAAYGALIGGLTCQALKLIPSIHAFFYRLTGGKFGGRRLGLQVLLLTTTGRKTGKSRTTPLGYFEHEGGYILCASSGGAETHPGWFYNLKNQPQVRIQINDRQMKVKAEIVGKEQRAQLWARLIELSPAYALYANRTRRQIPLVILRIKSLDSTEHD
jgi:deazaflavin-dependent oxidoreductase (nitroreductase family)